MIDQHFEELKKEPTTASDVVDVNRCNNPKIGGNDVVGKLTDINDDTSVKLLVDSMQGRSTLQIMSACMNEFGGYYTKMSLSDWNKTLKKYLS